MPRNTSQHDIIEYRRERVASLRLQGLTQRAITEQLGDEGVMNPETGKPFALGTVNNDIEALEEAWRQQTMANNALRHGRILAELDEVRRLAWSRGDPHTILRALKQESDLIDSRVSELLKRGETYVNSLPGRAVQVQLPQQQSLTDLIRKAQLHAEPGQVTELLDEYMALASQQKSFMDRLRRLADPVEINPQQMQQAFEKHDNSQAENENERAAAI